MTCLITVDNVTIDVERIYRERGFDVLPPQLTMTGFWLAHYGDVPGDRTIYKDNPHVPVPHNEAYPVADGDSFTSVPNAITGVMPPC